MSHPFAPFVSETIWQTLPWCDDLLINSSLVEPVEYSEISAEEFTRLQGLVSEARYVMAELPGSDKYTLLYQNDSLVSDNKELIKALAGLKEVEFSDQPRGLRLATSGREAWLDISAETLYQHQTNLEVRLAEVRQRIKTLEARLSNESYIKKAPPNLLEQTRDELRDSQTLAERLAHELEVIS
jgi:valyl-tRNA synthetase